MPSRVRRHAVLALLALLAPLTLLTPRAAAADPQPDAVSVPGLFGSEVGCAADWAPDCSQLQLTRRADDVWSLTLDLPAGDFAYKVAINRSFDVNYGLNAEPGGKDIPLVVPAGGAAVTFYYDNVTHWVTTDLAAPVVTAVGTFQSELGCAADWVPDCLRSWLQDVDGDGISTFTTSALPAGDYEVKAALGLSLDVTYGQDGAPDGTGIAFTVARTGSPTTFSYDAASHVLSVSDTAGLPGLTSPTAYFLSRQHLAWDLGGTDPATTSYALYAAPRGGLTVTADGVTGGTAYPLRYRPAGLPAALRERFPAQAGLADLELTGLSGARVRSLLRGQLAVVALNADGVPVAGAGLQIPGVLDDVYAAAGKKTLGLTWKASRPRLALWAPTAKSVSVRVYTAGARSEAVDSVPLARSASGVWSVRGPEWWRNRYYLYVVKVYVPETGRVETNPVTDPYSVGLSRNSVRSLMVDLDAKRLTPKGWSTLRKPGLAKPADQAITELHLRDFSISDPTVPAAHRGTYKAFTDSSSNAVAYLRGLSRAGMTTLHLLPLADMSTVDEDASTWVNPDCDLASYAPDSEQQQACVKPTLGKDGFNWGYDPLHYTTPEGSFSTRPNGSTRTREFRDMVKAVNGLGQRLVMDVVYNHTTDAGQSGRNNLDRIVPGYYHRLDAAGRVTTSTCCANTATEHLMMGKLMVDSVLTWTTAYKVDGFRFDLMGHQPKATMVELRRRLDRLTVARDGVDGQQVYLYGEGWDFGEVAQDALFVQATQANMAGTGIGTFNDRLRDAVRGGGPFDADPRIQGFGSGLYTDPNGAAANGTPEEQRARLLLSGDQIKVGLAGNLKSYVFTDRTGARVQGSQVDYNGQPAGYTDQPQEVINYVDAHDNETLYDGLTYKLPVGTAMADRIRMQTLSLSTTAFSQGISFWQTGSDALRSKSFDPNSYDSGDWFNVLDPSLQTNGYGRGLPVGSDDKWEFAKPLLADPALKPTPVDLAAAEAQSQTLLEIRRARPLLRLGSTTLIKQKLTFPGGGPDQTPGVIVMRLDDTVGRNVDPRLKGMVVVFNAGTTATTQRVRGTVGDRYRLDALQRRGSDPVVRTARHDAAAGTFTVPARTVAVFVEPGRG